GIRLTLELAFIVGLVATVLAVIVGVTAAFLGGVWDEVLSLLTNVVLVIPALPLLIVLLGYFQTTGQTATILVLSLLSWPWGARVVRAQTLAIRNRDFIAAARETGEKTWRIIAWEIVPNEVSLIAASFVNTGIDELGNPRLRDAASASRIAGRWLPPANPTPVLGDVSQHRGRVASFLHSFSRSSLID